MFQVSSQAIQFLVKSLPVSKITHTSQRSHTRVAHFEAVHVDPFLSVCLTVFNTTTLCDALSTRHVLCIYIIHLNISIIHEIVKVSEMLNFFSMYFFSFRIHSRPCNMTSIIHSFQSVSSFEIFDPNYPFGKIIFFSHKLFTSSRFVRTAFSGTYFWRYREIWTIFVEK